MDAFRGLARKVKALDAFPKTLEDVRVQTATGGVVSLVSWCVIAVLMIYEISAFLTPERHVELKVDVSRGEMMRVNLDIDFPAINCEVLGVDALDATGNVQLEIQNNLFKSKLDATGRPIKSSSARTIAERKRAVTPPTASFTPLPDDYCGDCYGAASAVKSGCCNTCEDVRAAYESKGWLLLETENVEQCLREGVHSNITNRLRPGEGCNIKGFIEVSKVQGNFHISPGHTFDYHGRHLHDMSAFADAKLDVSHTIHHLSFGDSFPGVTHPLDGVTKRASGEADLGMYEYFVKIVPTTFKGRFSSKRLKTNQYSVTEFFRTSDPSKGGRLLPGVFIVYDLSPILVEVEERRRSFFHFLVQLCAIIGGVYSVSGMVDSSIYHLPRILKKRRLGKVL
eukprot:CAMPEP_0185844114 /NCGR_PEP_ID=MMETSP1354-20130828/399_1 /TAXON_ID=708628 /ORGANISM="Erythrolobus madagascarensis, Strain CCMP3276" /LENGTH=395 /DNA_ID=CAMNT_0028543727 /DNA_START=1 /DNA_END=1188 /DNA_ORIENTATION=+